jgi:hypothetical protein
MQFLLESAFVFSLVRNTSFRGTLWIHAAAKVPEPELITAVESEYAGLRSRPLPKFYPTSVLLGCVEVVECLSMEERQLKGVSRAVVDSHLTHL